MKEVQRDIKYIKKCNLVINFLMILIGAKLLKLVIFRQKSYKRSNNKYNSICRGGYAVKHHFQQ